MCRELDTDPLSTKTNPWLNHLGTTKPCSGRGWSGRASWKRRHGRGADPWGGSHPPHLENDDKKEVEVGRAVELLVQVQGQEGEGVVLGRMDDIALQREPVWAHGQAQGPMAHRPPPWLPPALADHLQNSRP